MIIFQIEQIQNPSFESWTYITNNVPFAWDTIKNSNANCSWQIDSSNYRNSIKITINNNASGYDCAIAQAKGVSPSTTYNLSVWVYDNDPNIYARIYVQCYDNNNNLVNSSFVGSSSSDQANWQQLSGTYTTPINCSYLDFQIRTYDTGSPGGSVYIDGASLTTGAPPSELIESFDNYPPSQWIEVDLGITASGLLQRRTNACPFSSDNSCFGIKFRQQDADSTIFRYDA